MKSIKLMVILMLVVVNVFALSEEQVSRLREVEHLIIAPEEFIPLTNQLSDFYYDEFGIQRTVVDQQAIFDQYSGGNPDADAIKAYIEDFFDDPSVWLDCSVLLVGSGTEDWNTTDEKNRIMVLGETDDNFVELSGDSYPDIPIGRFPAQNLGQLELMINRNIQYIESPVLGWWRNKVLLVADDEHKNGAFEGIIGTGLNHTLLAQETGELLSRGVYVDKVLGIEYDFDEFGHKPEAAQDIIDRINEGRLVWFYIGHGNEELLGDEYYFQVSQHLQLLQNAEHLPLFVAASANVGHFDDPDFDCMAEIFMTYNEGGTIATVAPRGYCNGFSNSILLKHFLQNIINNGDYLGYGFLEAKLNCSSFIMNSRVFNLLGDPLLFVNPPGSDEFLTINGNPDTLFVGQEVEITGQVEPITGFEIADIKVFESEYYINYTNSLGDQTYTVDYSKFGEPFFEDEVYVFDGIYTDEFVIPEDIQFGEHGRIISYVYSEMQNIDYVNYNYPIVLSELPSFTEDDILHSSTVRMFNYPNPFNPSTTISYSLPEDSGIELLIYNIKGQKVRELESGFREKGTHNILWDGQGNNGQIVAGGVYFYKLKTVYKTISRRMVLLK